MFYASLCLSTLVAILFGAHATMLDGKRSSADRLAPWGVAFFPGMCLFIFSISYLLSLLLIFVLTISFYRVSRRRWLLIPVALFSVVLGHFIVYLGSRSEMQKNETIRQAFPTMNLDERLPRPDSSPYPAYSKLKDKNDVRRPWFSPGKNIEKLHRSQVDHFVNATGFGVTRVSTTYRELEYYLPNRNPVAQPGQAFTVDSLGEIEHPITDFQQSITLFNTYNLNKFTFPKGWGWQRTPKEIVAFMPHQLGKEENNLDVEGIPFSSDTRWSLRSIQLIGLLLAQNLRVYVTENLPRMDEAKNAPTRDLDPFEKAGLDAVGNGDEIYIGRHVSEPILRAVGPLRASQSCVACHRCEKGMLSGAFSYTLTQNAK